MASALKLLKASVFRDIPLKSKRRIIPL